MPLVVIYGIPAGTDTGTLEKLIPFLQLTVSSIDGLGIKPVDVDIDPHPNQVGRIPSEKIRALIFDLDKKPQITSAVLRDVASKVGLGIRYFFPGKEIRVCVHPMDQELCWSSDDKSS